MANASSTPKAGQRVRITAEGWDNAIGIITGDGSPSDRDLWDVDIDGDEYLFHVDEFEAVRP